MKFDVLGRISKMGCLTETPDGEGYFGFAPNHKAAIHVISYKKMLRDAELRNEVFFRKLGLIKAS